MLIRRKDTRLSWDPSRPEYKNITTISLKSPELEEYDIWVPDLKIYNGRSDLASTLSRAPASVVNDGSVFWSRPGNMEVLCKFSGLVAFPFDDLNCTFRVGGWVLSDYHQGIVFKPNAMTGEVGYEMKTGKNLTQSPN